MDKNYLGCIVISTFFIYLIKERIKEFKVKIDELKYARNRYLSIKAGKINN